MNALKVVLGRELSSYFATPVAYIFLVIFLMLSGVFTFYIGQFFERGQADLVAFFNFVPWLYLVLIPAVTMRLWSEERRSGTIELLMTLPLATWQVVLGKFLAAWLFVGLALVLTFPLWITVNYLGSPDNGVILGAYIGAWLMSGGFLAVGSCLSALSKNQIVAFILTLVVSFVLVVTGFPIVQDAFSGWAPLWLIDAVANLSFLTHFTAISRGVIDVRDLVYFAAMIGIWLYATSLVVDLKKAD
ncbi:ABC transporter permease [Oleiphilus sp. HI0009]|uniref:ABC transporter permease subunit n=1 Tax=unclassified Oleiphilus TaxID=2631174 RepID=UPI0007C2A8FC|nr:MULTISPECIES: ABC transporter permease subunit [unclassified Oleiphilus]KZX75093.1 ABC transporter permease [Oleiphilus sp. HI0009]MCH2158721.1 ABC transporter permease subunit [Oleiphilaceae bacterium]KZY70067.1 ABC transporter permease [Oleiphilus sp. HI0067]KZY71393.1 ABC transporter permease [Oleiphilus sp. HI0067]KZY71739.1 ABC transporter permease [Oleiphilus sp. HI0066]